MPLPRSVTASWVLTAESQSLASTSVSELTATHGKLPQIIVASIAMHAGDRYELSITARGQHIGGWNSINYQVFLII